MNKKLKIIMIFFSLTTIIWLYSGCATVFKGSTERVYFSSSPTEAKVYINGQFMGTTPLRLKLESKNIYNIEFRKEGFETKFYTITHHIGTTWVILDVIVGLVPVVVDAVTGAWYSLDDDYVKAHLKEEKK